VGAAPQWLRPFPWLSGERLLAIAAIALRQGLPVLHLMLHSSELLPGGSPYGLTEHDVEQVFDSLDHFFGALAASGIPSAGLEEIYHAQRVPPAPRLA
jgi:hypothetical protein